MALQLSGDIAGLGKVVQIVRATDTVQRSTTSTSAVDASISVTITPKKSDSAIIVVWSARAQQSNNSYGDFLITDASNNWLEGAQLVGNGDGSSTTLVGQITAIGYATPATTSATTYKGRFLTNTGTATIRNDLSTGQMYAIEVAA